MTKQQLSGGERKDLESSCIALLERRGGYSVQVNLSTVLTYRLRGASALLSAL